MVLYSVVQNFAYLQLKTLGEKVRIAIKGMWHLKNLIDFGFLYVCVQNTWNCRGGKNRGR